MLWRALACMRGVGRSAGLALWSGLIDWQVAGLLLAGGLLGAVAGSRANAVLARNKGRLSHLFAWFVVVAGLYYVAGRGSLSLLTA